MNYTEARIIKVSHNRMIKRTFGVDVGYIILVVYEISESTTVFSDRVIEARKSVDESFYDIIDTLTVSTFKGWTIDSTGSLLTHGSYKDDSSSIQTFPIHEFIEYLPESRSIFKSLELGCCSTYSHHILGTRCLCCAIITDSIDNIPKSLVNYSE